MSVRIYPYRMASRSATRLARALGGRKVWPDRNYRPRRSHTIINWGAGTLPEWTIRAVQLGCEWINSPGPVCRASNKLSFFESLTQAGQEDIIPEYTTDPEVARGWVWDDEIVVARHMLRASSGRGIHVWEGRAQYDRFVHANRAPLYVKYIKKFDEYRVHVGRYGESYAPFHLQVKRARRELPVEDRNYRVRNYEAGWVFCIQDVEAPEAVNDVACRAVASLGLDFGAVDVVFNSHTRSAKVLEVNTACGLQAESTLNAYVNYIRENT